MQKVQVRYVGFGSKSYTYGWNGAELLKKNDIVLLPQTSLEATGNWVLGMVTDTKSDYDGDLSYVLRAIRGRMLK